MGHIFAVSIRYTLMGQKIEEGYPFLYFLQWKEECL